jgi:5,10-methylenetetrahydrofolate reductase
VSARAAATPRTTFRQALRGARPALLVTPPAPRPDALDDWLRAADGLAERADALHLPAPGADGIAPLALSALLLRHGIDPVPELSGHDRNRIALHSDLLGLRALGVTSLLAGGGGPRVVDVGAEELIATAAGTGEADADGTPFEFIVGAGLDLPLRAADLARRAQAGVRFLLTAPDAAVDDLRTAMNELVAARLTWRCAVIVTAAAPPGAARDQRIAFCADRLAAAAAMPGVSGFNLAGIDRADELDGILARAGLPRHG